MMKNRVDRVMSPENYDIVGLGKFRFIFEKNANYRTPPKIQFGLVKFVPALEVFFRKLIRH